MTKVSELKQTSKGTFFTDCALTKGKEPAKSVDNPNKEALKRFWELNSFMALSSEKT
jgi:hypothetical protein